MKVTDTFNLLQFSPHGNQMKIPDIGKAEDLPNDFATLNVYLALGPRSLQITFHILFC